SAVLAVTAALVGPVSGHAGVPARAETIVQFAGLPVDGVQASTPTTRRLVLRLRTIPTTDPDTAPGRYADPRLLPHQRTPSYDATVAPDGARELDTGYVQQRLTPRGVRLLRSKILATGLFAHNLTVEVGGHRPWAIDQVRVGNHFVTVRGMPFGRYTK